jgi:hypothetical protein
MRPLNPLFSGLPPRVVQVATYACAGLAALCWATYSGPYRWLAERQMQYLDHYYAFYTWAGTMLLLMVPVLGGLEMARRLGFLPNSGLSPDQARRARYDHAAQFQRFKAPFILLVLGGTFLFFGGRDWLRAQGGKQLEQLSAATLEGGKKPTSTWLEVAHGSSVWDASIVWTSDRSTVTYVPFVSEGWKEGGPVGVVLKLNTDELPRAQKDPPSFKGVADELGLPGPVAAAYKDAGLNAARVLVLHVGVDPARDGESGSMFALIGLAVMALGAGVGVYIWKRG